MIITLGDLADQIQTRGWIEAIAKELGIKAPPVTINILKPTCYSLTDEEINLNPLQICGYGLRGLAIVCLAHEMRHAWQHQTGVLTIGDPNAPVITWMGQAYALPEVITSADEHAALPWEQDAIAYEHEFAKRHNFSPYPRDLKSAA